MPDFNIHHSAHYHKYHIVYYYFEFDSIKSVAHGVDCFFPLLSREETGMNDPQNKGAGIYKAGLYEEREVTGPLPRLSLEIFPPKSLAASFQLMDTLDRLARFGPHFVSVTQTAAQPQEAGKLARLTQEAALAVRQRTGLDMAVHLTCASSGKGAILEQVRDCQAAGINRFVALRGDPPDGSQGFAPLAGGFADCVQLIAALAEAGATDIFVAAYPEPHPASRGPEADIDWLKRKQDAGATAAITQFFFDPEVFLRLRDRAIKAAITIPIIPGILPIENFAATCRFARKCGTAVPASLAREFAHAERHQLAAVHAVVVAVDICARLIAEGVADLHFYTLNKAALTRDVCLALGYEPAKTEAEAA
jgi:methylenetetrahydrofolate reductase (NADPH)